MTKKRSRKAASDDNGQRQSRKEVLLARKEREQTGQIRLAVFGILGLIVAVILAALVSEFIIVPQQPVATVNGEDISLDDFRNRVKFQRAQFIINIEDQLEAFGDLGLVQQFSGQQLVLLQDHDELGQIVLDQMINDLIIRQEAEERGITVTEADIEEALEGRFSYFEGESPTPQPTAMETIMPTPSLTPVPTEVITDVLPTNTPFPTPTLGPTGTPRPTATAVSLESFQESSQTELDRFRDMGVSEETYRSVIVAELYREKLQAALAEAGEIATEGEHISYFFISTESEEEANEALAQIESDGFIETWNLIRSTPTDSENPTSTRSGERLWQTQEQLDGTFGTDVATAAFGLEVGDVSDVVARPGTTEEEPTTYYIMQVSGREVRDLSEATVNNAETQLLADLVQNVRDNEDLDLTSTVWRSRIPRTPVVDPSYYEQPTPVPVEDPAGGS